MPNNFTSMDYNDLMDSLVLYMQSQDEFKDFNYDGSAIREFLRLLAYNAQQQSYQNNFVFNELQHDSAQLRQNLTSLASRLGYVADSKRAAKIAVNIVVTPTNLATADASIVLDRSVTFYATKDGSAFIFSPLMEYTAPLSNGVYVFENVILVQGVWALNSYMVQVQDGTESYVLPNDKIDTNTLEVYVRSSDTSTDQVKYNQFATSYDLSESSAIFFLRENRSGLFEFKFGDGIFAKQLGYGNVITARYLVTEGSNGNNIGVLNPASSISGYYNIKINKIDSFSYGGTDEESIESIRTMSTLGFTSSDNAVTAGDYVAIIKKIFPEAADVVSWGGEDNDPPKYGYMFLAVKPKNGEFLSDVTKSALVDQIKKYNIGPISPIIADPDYTYINVDTTVKYDPKALTITTNSAKAKVIDSLNTYSVNSIEKFDGRLDMSKLSEYINSIDQSIVGNFTKVSYEKHIVPLVNYTGNYDIKFYHAINAGSLLIEGFRVADTNGGNTTSYSISDDGSGVLRLVATLNSVVRVLNTNIGTVDYTNGTVAIRGFRPSSLIGDVVTVKTVPSDAYDIDSSITAFNNVILKLNTISVKMIPGTA